MLKILMAVRHTAFACLLLFASPSFAQSIADPRVAQAFPELAESDLTPEEGYRFGVLDNGMRYIIRANATPPERGLVRMWVDFGSVAEEADEQGYAHFIEHMAFNGTTNIPEGEMVPLLERKGLSFGADTNASTGFNTTQYRLDLPRNDTDLLDTALMLMRETASEITFDEEAVQREKGIILSERRVRDTFGFRASVDNLNFVWPGSRLAQRLPIGTIETIEAATGERLRALYQRYYRPENVAIVVVGDYDVDAVEAMIAERFGDWQGEAALEAVGFGPVDQDNAGRTSIYLDPALSEQLTISQIGPWRDRPDTAANRAASLQARLGYSILSRRLTRLLREDDPPFRGASLNTSSFGEEARATGLTITAAEGQWERALAAAQAEYRRALEHGFTQAELDEVLANIRARSEAAVAGSATRGNGAFVGEAFGLLRNGSIPTSPEDGLARFNALASAITPEGVLAAFRDDVIALDNPLIRFQGRTAPEGGEDALRAAWERGTTIAIAPPEDRETAEFAYTDFGTPGAVIADETDSELGIRRIRFANGVMLNLKPTALQEDRVTVQINIDGGDMLNTRDNPLRTTLAGLTTSGGLGAHTIDELQSILAGRVAGLSFGSGAETFRLGQTTTPQDLELQLQLLTALITDPAFRPTGEEQYRRSVVDGFARLRATPGSALSADLGGILSDNDPRFTRPEEADLLALTVADLRDALAERLANGAIEVALVGDFEEDAAIAFVAATLGALPQREAAFQPYEDRRDRAFTDDRTARTLYHEGEADQALLYMIWPTRDNSDLKESVTLDLAEATVRLQLQSVLREELGQTYSPGVNAFQSSVFTGYGTFSLSAQIATDDVSGARDAMLRVIRDLSEQPITEDLLLRARQPLLERYDNALETNGSWMALVDRAQSEPDDIVRFLQGRDVITRITADDVQAVIRRYLAIDERVEVTVLPQIENGGSSGVN